MANIYQHFFVNHTSLPLVQLPAKVVEQSARTERAGSDLRTQVTPTLCYSCTLGSLYLSAESYCAVRVLESCDFSALNMAPAQQRHGVNIDQTAFSHRPCGTSKS